MKHPLNASGISQRIRWFVKASSCPLCKNDLKLCGRQGARVAAMAFVFSRAVLCVQLMEVAREQTSAVKEQCLPTFSGQVGHVVGFSRSVHELLSNSFRSAHESLLISHEDVKPFAQCHLVWRLGICQNHSCACFGSVALCRQS